MFRGHNHSYYRTLRNIIMHVITGGGGDDLYGDGDHSKWQEGYVSYSTYHYCNVTVSNS